METWRKYYSFKSKNFTQKNAKKPRKVHLSYRDHFTIDDHSLGNKYRKFCNQGVGSCSLKKEECNEQQKF